MEIELLLEGIFRMYGYDFRNYAYPSIRRRIWHRVNAWRLGSISALQEKVLHDARSMESLLSSLIINVTEMYRDPELFLAFRKLVVPVLRTYPFIRIWHAGCSTGEEVLSMAILLHEEGLYDKARIYATDISEEVLNRAREAVFPLRKMQDYTRNYLLAGGTGGFSEYYAVKNEEVHFHRFLLDNVVFAQHNLVTDQSFNEFNVIFCRNVLIYFNKTLQDQVHRLFYESLSPLGILALGTRESINFSHHADDYEALDSREKLYRKIR
ncbi:protein-glutamate O-methyltransferase CheR [Paenibacillus sp. CC-CFT747]|nr:protein-glutamate O-methyltransferase CheR [Paenibacillus sp. CC-CFT747]